MRHAVLICALASGLVGARAAAAAPGDDSGVRVVVADTCPRVDRAQLSRLLNIEQRRDAGSGVEQARVSVACEGDAVTLRVEERGDGSLPRARMLRAADVTGEVGARVLALAAIELLNARSAPPAPEPEPKPKLVGRAVPPPPRSVPRPKVRLMALALVRTFRAERPFVGYGSSVDYLRLAHFGLKLDFDLALDDRRYDLGSAHVQLMTLSAQAGYLVLQNSWWVQIFGGYRFGSGRISGESATGVGAAVGTVSGPCGGPLLALGLGSTYGIWSLGLGAEAGLVSFPLEGRVEGHQPISLNHYWLGSSLSVGALL